MHSTKHMLLSLFFPTKSCSEKKILLRFFSELGMILQVFGLGEFYEN